MKYLQITMPNGERWGVPISVIARDRANYYADKDTERDGLSKEQRDKRYEDEYRYTLEDELEIYDWAPNNMNWIDVKEHAIEIGAERLTERGYQEGWINGDKTIIDLSDISVSSKTGENDEG